MLCEFCRSPRHGLTLFIALAMVLNASGCLSKSGETGLVSCEDQPDQTTARDISCSELTTMILNRPDLLIVDVRTLQEWKQGHIAGAGHIDFLEDDFDSQAFALPKNMPIVLYCAAGGRSSDAMEKMKKAGFRELFNLRGGFYGWEDAGQSVSHDPPSELVGKGQ